ncbi:hypothetical protein DAEQUDRAFT_8535 [Daedalea quercina L-15889]|uniref:Uncharacterized protein n=1 Tax=Daedalea quercina L-15889 TaxID=1314783 RepID=A0A165UF64_9APHY|nr:hypothetical protein DAEQUDRAFT_8535 [Daedalea quercina L-15889]
MLSFVLPQDAALIALYLCYSVIPAAMAPRYPVSNRSRCRQYASPGGGRFDLPFHRAATTGKEFSEEETTVM